jgi:hypothetical protein
VARYAVAHATNAPHSAEIFARLVRELVRADVAAQGESASSADDDLVISSFVAIEGPIMLGRQVGYLLRHRVAAPSGTLSMDRVRRHLEDVLDVPQRESGRYSIRSIEVVPSE